MFQTLFRKLIQKLRDLPKYMRIICIAVGGFFGFIGLAMSLKSAAEGLGFFTMFLYYLLILLVAEAMTIGAYYLVIYMSTAAIRQKVQQIYGEEGFCEKLAQCVADSFSAGDVGTKLQRMFFYLMAEDYENAEKHMIPLVDYVSSSRETAMLTASRMWLYAMTGRMERAERMFQETEEEQCAAYQRQPDMEKNYRPELDDTLLYYMFASAMSLRMQDGTQLSKYKGPLDFQISKRCDTDQRMYPEIYKLFLLYAKGDLVAAQELEHSLLAEIEASGLSIPYARRGDLRRLTQQARLFAKYVQTEAPKQRRPLRSPEQEQMLSEM